MALEIEQPFGDDPNDLPIEGYLLGLEKELLQMLPDRQRDLRLASEPPPGGTDDNDESSLDAGGGAASSAKAPSFAEVTAKAAMVKATMEAEGEYVSKGSTPQRRVSPAAGMMESAEQRLLGAKAAAEGALGYQRLHDEGGMDA